MHSGWLSKLTTNNAFGTSRWQARYFILLDSELRYYKNEHATTASKTINLRDIAKVSIVQDISHHPYVLQLEPTFYFQHNNSLLKNQKKKCWLLACQSELELKNWLDAINLRVSKLSSPRNTSEEELVLSPSVQPFSTPEENRQQPFMSLDTALEVQPRIQKRSRPTISRRRGVILSQLDIDIIPALEKDNISSSSSKSFILPSPNATHQVKANKIIAQNAYVMDTSSASFALYKQNMNH